MQSKLSKCRLEKMAFPGKALNTPSPPGVGVPPRFGDIRDFLAILGDIREKLTRTGQKLSW